jgi:serine/threonine-protein kinase RIM15
MLLVLLGYTVDWWALGVMLYEFLIGFPPFYDDTPAGIFQNILAGKINWPEEDDGISPEAKDLISRLLIEDSNERLGANGMFAFFLIRKIIFI